MGPEFERSYFEERASYGARGGYANMLDQARSFYAEYFRIAAGFLDGFERGNGRRALEAGCAFGAGSGLLHRMGYDVVATDVSEYACERARELLPPQVPVRRIDLETEGASLGTFDLVVCIQVIEHVPGEAFVRALCDRVAPGGSLLLATPNPLSLSPYRKFQADPTHVNERPPQAWIASLRANGLVLAGAGTYHVIPVVHRWSGLRLLRAPQWLGYDTVIAARR